ncbi:MAG TPA: MFS transporter [Candidatus Limnocylindrales bacterium]|nr:MFS transporter [Candidatus Limnocylindrales bacterium]
MTDGTHPNRAHDDGLWSPGRRALTIGLVLNVTIVASEALAVGTILPIVAKDLGGIDLYGWVFSGFFLGNLLGIVVAGILIDRGGLTRPFLMGIGLFAIGLLVGGLAPSMEILVIARLIQGFGAGAIPAVAYVSIGRAMPAHLRPRMFATLSTAWILPGVIGPVAASAVTGLLNWRIVFLGLLPLIAIAATLTLPAIRAVAAAPAAAAGTPASARIAAGRVRLPLAFVLVVGAGLVVSGLSNVSPIPLVLIVIGIAIGAPAFARLTPRGTIRAATGLPTAILLRGFLTFAFFCADAYVPLVIQGWRGDSAYMAGFTYMAATLAWTGGSWVNAHHIGRLGPGRFLRVGFVVVLVGIVGFLAVLLPWVPPAAGIVIWGVAGFGMGLAYSTPSLIVLSEAPAGEQGAATAGLQLSDVLGASLGTGIGGALIAFGSRAGSPGWEGLAATFAVAGVVALIGLALTTRLGARTAAGLPPTHLGTATAWATSETGRDPAVR